MSKLLYLSGLLMMVSPLQASQQFSPVEDRMMSRMDAEASLSPTYLSEIGSIFNRLPAALRPYAQQSATSDNVRLYLTEEDYCTHKAEVDASGATLVIVPDHEISSLQATQGSQESRQSTVRVDLSQTPSSSLEPATQPFHQ